MSQPERQRAKKKEIDRLRKIVLAKGARCAALVDPDQRGKCFGPMELDHILSKARGGEDTEENTQPLCQHHNTLKEDEPDWAYEHGLSKHSWEPTIPRIDRGREHNG